MNRIKTFLASLNHAIALRTTIHLFLCIGLISSIVFLLNAHWLLAVAALPFGAFAWFILYKFEEGLSFTTAIRPREWKAGLK